MITFVNCGFFFTKTFTYYFKSRTWGDRGSGDRVVQPMFGGSAVWSLPNCIMVVVSLGKTLECECVWLYVWGGEPVGAEWQPHFCQSAPAVAAAVEVYHHQYDWVWMNGTWNPVRHFGWLEKCHTNPIHYYERSHLLLWAYICTTRIHNGPPCDFSLDTSDLNDQLITQLNNQQMNPQSKL